MTEFKIIFKNEDGENLLQCSHCGEVFLHQFRIEVFAREEDESEGCHVTVGREKNVTIDRDISRNPSPRRSGLKVWFFCEICGHNSVLDIWQHKGQTYLKII